MMRLRTLAGWVSAAAFVSAAVPLGAQSLADLARKEEERRKTITEPSKVYTNKDLTAAPPVSSPPPAAATAASTPASGAAEPAKPADNKNANASGETAEKDSVKDQAYWGGRMKKMRDQLDRDQTYSEALQSRVNALNTDFVNRDDPAQRAVIERDRLKALDELNRLKQQIVTDKKALVDLEEEARRAGVPPGWLR